MFFENTVDSVLKCRVILERVDCAEIGCSLIDYDIVSILIVGLDLQVMIKTQIGHLYFDTRFDHVG